MIVEDEFGPDEERALREAFEESKERAKELMDEYNNG